MLFARRTPSTKPRRHRIAFEAQATTRDGAGQQQLQWTQVGAPAWAEIGENGVATRSASSREQMAAGAERASATYVVTLRYRAGITAAMRVRFGTRYFNILAVRNLAQRNQWLELECEEGLTDG